MLQILTPDDWRKCWVIYKTIKVCSHTADALFYNYLTNAQNYTDTNPRMHCALEIAAIPQNNVKKKQKKTQNPKRQLFLYFSI